MKKGKQPARDNNSYLRNIQTYSFKFQPDLYFLLIETPTFMIAFIYLKRSSKKIPNFLNFLIINI